MSSRACGRSHPKRANPWNIAGSKGFHLRLLRGLPGGQLHQPVAPCEPRPADGELRQVRPSGIRCVLPGIRNGSPHLGTSIASCGSENLFLHALEGWKGLLVGHSGWWGASSPRSEWVGRRRYLLAELLSIRTLLGMPSLAKVACHADRAFAHPPASRRPQGLSCSREFAPWAG